MGQMTTKANQRRYGCGGQTRVSRAGVATAATEIDAAVHAESTTKCLCRHPAEVGHIAGPRMGTQDSCRTEMDVVHARRRPESKTTG